MPNLQDHEVPGIVDQLRSLSHEARQQRANRNRDAWRIVNGELDFSKKQDGQSCLVIPDLARGLEQVKARIERELTNSNAWFTIEPFEDVPEELMDAETLHKLVLHRLRHLWSPGYLISGARTVESVIADGIGLGLVEGEITIKVAPITTTRPVIKTVVRRAPSEGSAPSYALPQIEIERRDVTQVLLDIQAIPFEDAFPDPSGANAWFVHETTAKVSDLRANPDYDQAALDRLDGKVANRDQESSKQARDGSDAPVSVARGTVRLREFWGDLIDKDGSVRATNVLCTVADGELLRSPVPNPLLHGAIPIVRGVLRSNPLSQVAPAFIDLAIDPYLAENELYNLMLDAAKASVWGVRQIRPDMLENEAELSGGITSGSSWRLKRDAGAGQFIERVDEPGQINDAAVMLNKLGQSREVALATPDLQLGQLPDREVLATEIISTAEGSGTLFDAITGRLEDQVIEPVVRLSLFALWQYLEDFTDPGIVRLIGPERAELLGSLTAEERFELIAQPAAIRVTGLREMTGRVRELRKLTTGIQLISQNPALAQVFDQEFSMSRMLGFMFRQLGVDVAEIKKRPGEEPELDPTLLNAQAGGGGNPDVEAESQSVNPGNLEGENGQIV